MRSFSRILPSILLLSFMAGCAPEQRLGPSGEPKGTITHLLLCWMYNRGDDRARNEILAAGQKLEHLPGVVNVVGGRILRSEGPLVDNTFDVALIVTFRSESDLHHFLDDKDQAAAMTNVLRYAKVKAYDFVAE